VFPPEPPVVSVSGRNGAPIFGAAERTLAGEHRSGMYGTIDGRLWREHDRRDSRWWA